jgi:hypothetical protein
VNRLPFDKPGAWWRGNLHTHSTVSDGKRTPAEVIATYREQGYDFIALTDHFMERFGFPVVDTSEFRDDGFTTLFGAELHGPALSHGDIWHIVAAGLPLDFTPAAPGETGPEIAARAQAAGAFVGIAHPAWYTLTLEDARTIAPFADAVEVYNHTCRHDNDRGDGWYLSDQLAMVLDRPLLAYAADDAHFNTRPDFFGGWVWVKAESRTPEALLAALKTGAYYSSQGPQIHDVRREGDEMVIATSPVAEIYISGAGSKNRSIQRSLVTGARLPLDRFSGSWARVTVVDFAGRRAWTSPFMVEG